jgi:hypothetical protein
MLKYVWCLILWLGLFCLAPLAAGPLPPKIDYNVPFTCQAPFGNWKEPYQEACEEAALIMAQYYWIGRALNKETANREILNMIAFQKKHFGGHFDLPVAQIAKLGEAYFDNHQLRVVYDCKFQDIQTELAEGNLVIVPCAGRLLRNPNFTPPGPVYHNLVIKGYDEQKKEFITNDPGTRKGLGYRYAYLVLYNAIHDWTGSAKTINQGRKAMLVVETYDT